jgi:hypothetical protein
VPVSFEPLLAMKSTDTVFGGAGVSAAAADALAAGAASVAAAAGAGAAGGASLAGALVGAWGGASSELSPPHAATSTNTEATPSVLTIVMAGTLLPLFGHV